MPNIYSANLNESFIFFGKLLPIKSKVMTVTISGIVDLNDPHPI